MGGSETTASAFNRAMLAIVAMPSSTAFFAHRASAMTFLLGIVLVSLVLTLVLQALLGPLLGFAGLALPMVLAQALGIALAVAVAHRYWPTTDVADTVAVERARSLRLLAALLAGAAMQFPLSAVGGWVMNYFPMDEKQVLFMHRLVYPETVSAALIAAVGIGCVVPICEEWLYRRTVLSRLRKRVGAGPAVVITSVLFGLAHFAPHAIVGAALAGLILGWLYLRAGLWLAIAFHMGVNLTPFVFRPDWIPIAGFNLLEDSSDLPVPLWVGGIVVGTLSLFFISRGCASGQSEQL